jgi:AbrB family looped-hinge helix DNA binding protein
MAKITVKGQVTLPKNVRDAVGLKPGDEVEVRATASGGVYIGKPGASQRYRERLDALAKRRPIRGITTAWKRAEAKFPLGPQSIGSEFGASSPHRPVAKWGAIARLDRAIQ